MRRPAKGGTSHPPVARPGMGFGRPLRPNATAISRADLESEYAALLRGEESVTETPRLAEERSSITGSDLLS
ncbi:MAG: hypothetical protein ACXVJ7_07365 [Acidimicrobiia bacterium]